MMNMKDIRYLALQAHHPSQIPKPPWLSALFDPSPTLRTNPLDPLVVAAPPGAAWAAAWAAASAAASAAARGAVGGPLHPFQSPRSRGPWCKKKMGNVRKPDLDINP
jgi:hypothetical protein